MPGAHQASNWLIMESVRSESHSIIHSLTRPGLDSCISMSISKGRFFWKRGGPESIVKGDSPKKANTCMSTLSSAGEGCDERQPGQRSNCLQEIHEPPKKISSEMCHVRKDSQNPEAIGKVEPCYMRLNTLPVPCKSHSHTGSACVRLKVTPHYEWERSWNKKRGNKQCIFSPLLL